MKINPIHQPAIAVMALAASALLVGCASGPKYSDYRPTVRPCPNGQGRIWFYRPSAMGAAVQPGVKLDGRLVGKAAPHGFFHTETTPGPHEVSITTEWTHKKTVTVAANCDSYVRLNMMMGLFVGHVVPKEVPPDKALSEIKNLHLAQ